jgi:hypothetical protein
VAPQLHGLPLLLQLMLRLLVLRLWRPRLRLLLWLACK